MSFFLRDGWHIQFLEPDLQTALPLKLTFRDAAKIRELFDRFVTEKKLEDRQALEYAIATGRGSLWLNLTDEQYAKLKT